MDRWYAFLHFFAAFGFVGSLTVAEWNGRAARATADWGQRAALFDVVARSTRMVGLGPLLLLGVLGNLLAVARGHRMATEVWLRWVNGLWVAAVLLLVWVCLPAAVRLVAIARSAAGGASADGWEPTLRRWRLGNLGSSLLYLALLALMVFRWKG